MLARQVMTLLELRLVSNQLKQTNELLMENNNSLISFNRILAHDIKAPVNNMLLLSQTLTHFLNKDSNEEQISEIANLLADTSSSVSNMIDGVLKYSLNSALVELRGEPFNLMKEVNAAARVLDPLKKYTWNLNISSDLKIDLNRTAIFQIFLNLFSNAIKYNDKENVFIEVVVNKNGPKLMIHIRDNGPGIPNELAHEIFHVFFQADKSTEGQGIGLATVKTLISKMEGVIYLDKNNVQGACFVIEFDLAIV